MWRRTTKTLAVGHCHLDGIQQAAPEVDCFCYSLLTTLSNIAWVYSNSDGGVMESRRFDYTPFAEACPHLTDRTDGVDAVAKLMTAPQWAAVRQTSSCRSEVTNIL